MSDLKNNNLVKENFFTGSTASNLIFNEKVKALIKSGLEIAHFGFGQSPFPVPECLVEQLKKFAHINSYLPIKGIPELRKAISDFHLRYDNLHLDPENLIVAPGSKELIYLIIYLFNGTLLLHSPSWSTYQSQCHLSGKKPLIVLTEERCGWKVTPKDLIKALEHVDVQIEKGNKLLILTNPGNPTGTCYTEKEVKDLCDFCRANKIFILSDEIFSRLTFSGVHHSPLKFYPEGVIMTNGFSKWASVGGWRVGYAYFPSSMKQVLDAVVSAASNTYSCTPAPMQYATAQAITFHSEELDEYISHCPAILKLVGDYCYRELSLVGVSGAISEAGFSFILNLEVIREGLRNRGIKTGLEMTSAMLKEADVALMDSSTFLRPSTELTTRFCFVCFDGSKTLKAYKTQSVSGQVMTASNEAGRLFLETHCPTLVDGVKRLVKWIENCQKL